MWLPDQPDSETRNECARASFVSSELRLRPCGEGREALRSSRTPSLSDPIGALLDDASTLAEVSHLVKIRADGTTAARNLAGCPKYWKALLWKKVPEWRLA